MDITLVLVTLLSLTLAAVMTTLAWRLAREERRRSDARVAALAAEIAGPQAALKDLPLRHPPFATPVVTSGDLFAAARPSQARSRFAAVFAGGVIVVGSAVTLVVALSGAGRSSASRQPQPVPAAPAEAAPLELVALTHERGADRLTVRGIVRNPASGTEVARLTAVVFVFNQDGGFVASGRAGVDGPVVPGAEVPFAVIITDANDVGRYRVSFRTDEGVVPHVDRRDRPVAQRK